MLRLLLVMLVCLILWESLLENEVAEDVERQPEAAEEAGKNPGDPHSVGGQVVVAGDAAADSCQRTVAALDALLVQIDGDEKCDDSADEGDEAHGVLPFRFGFC